MDQSPHHYRSGPSGSHNDRRPFGMSSAGVLPVASYSVAVRSQAPQQWPPLPRPQNQQHQRGRPRRPPPPHWRPPRRTHACPNASLLRRAGAVVSATRESLAVLNSALERVAALIDAAFLLESASRHGRHSSGESTPTAAGYASSDDDDSHLVGALAQLCGPDAPAN